jgi:adenine C2-methylase RlmN of 23S rRNA A2503 and tRNA A37
METRKTQFEKLFPNEPAFRWKQIEDALFSSANGWDEATTIPKSMRESLKEIPWLSVGLANIQVSANGETHKALLNVEGGKQIESVLMANRRGAWTICVSSQVGCAMRCSFCATGKMGLTRNLSSDEIVDQYRFWKMYSENTLPPDHLTTSPRISNIVIMGMGEPLANYEEVRGALNTLLAKTDIGPTHITVSTVGILPRLEQILTDKQWPPVRLAVSLHSAIESTRKQIVPTSYDEFLPGLERWAKNYLKLHGNRRHHLTFEYVMLKGVNDSPTHAKALSTFVNRIGRIKVNLIPYNLTGVDFERSDDTTITAFHDSLQKNNVTATVRRAMGADITAACGQLSIDNPANFD